MADPHTFHLDHLSLQVLDMGQTVRQFDERLGLEALLNNADPEHHGRIHFDSSYVELAVPPVFPPRSPPWTIPWFFLRFSDAPEALYERLKAAGLSPSLQIFEGEDGCWTELRLEVPGGTPTPLLRHRPRPEPVSAAHGAQPCGAFGLASVVLLTPDLAGASDVYRRLLGLEKLPEPFTDRVFTARRMDLPLAGGRICLIQPEGHGFASAFLGARGSGPMGFQLAVESFWQPEELIARLGLRSERGITPRGAELWLDPKETFGVPVGFVEALAPVKGA
jgi:catechol 2,3-dioxygenase-like lactoylglutathione lyase family enzyme